MMFMNVDADGQISSETTDGVRMDFAVAEGTQSAPGGILIEHMLLGRS
jgi:hypothetical protein